MKSSILAVAMGFFVFGRMNSLFMLYAMFDNQ
ncbi:uncharacterized protein METZ01_LOCUS332047, partial [marine metagenome]